MRTDEVLYSYDIHGNVTEKVGADGRVQYTYDSRQQLIRVDFPDGTSVSYAYDAFGRRVMRDETYWHNNGRLRSDVVHYLYDGLEVLKEYGGTPGEGRPPLAEYWRANGRIVARRLYGNPTRPGLGNDDFLFTRGGLLYYHYDALGTVQALTDRQGDVLAQYYYDAYGQPWAGPLGAYNAYALTGKEYDAKTGLYYFGARWYDPQVGRWMSQDPARDGLNWYAYVGNSPTAYVDFWGLLRVASEEKPPQTALGAGFSVDPSPMQRYLDTQQTHHRYDNQFGTGMLGFMEWEINSERLGNPETGEGGSDYWRYVNESVVAEVMAVGVGGYSHVPTVSAWENAFEQGTQDAWWNAHNRSIFSAHQSEQGQRYFREEPRSEQRFIENVVLPAVHASGMLSLPSDISSLGDIAQTIYPPYPTPSLYFVPFLDSLLLQWRAFDGDYLKHY